MADGVLSQKEIDELLSMLSTADSEESEAVEQDDQSNVKLYNFKTANKFPKEQIRTLSLIYENYATRLSLYLSNKLRTLCTVEVESIEEVSFGEFINSIPPPVLLSVMTMQPLKGSILYKISSGVAYEIIGRLLGGQGDSDDLNKSYTEIELSILDRLTRQMIQLMDEAWKKVVEVKSRMVSMETSSQFVQIVETNEPTVIITLKVKIGNTESFINLCIPHIAVQPIKNKLAMKKWYSGNDKIESTEEEKERINAVLNSTKLTLHAVFEKTEATVKEVVSLNEGDVIKINHFVDTPLIINIEHIPKLRCMMGTKGSNYAMKVCSIIREDD